MSRSGLSGKTLPPHSPRFAGGFLFSLFILVIYVSAGYFPGSSLYYLPALLIIALVGTVVESLPLKDIDNITITLAAVVLGYFLF